MCFRGVVTRIQCQAALTAQWEPGWRLENRVRARARVWQAYSEATRVGDNSFYLTRILSLCVYVSQYPGHTSTIR